MGDRVQNIESALRLMNENTIKVIKASPLYETKAMYYENQAPFLNGACEVSPLMESRSCAYPLLGLHYARSFGPVGYSAEY